MADVMRWRYGETNPVQVKVLAESVIQIGDLVYLDQGSAKSAKTIAGIGSTGPASVAAAQEYFHDRWLGVAMQRSQAGESGEVRVATSGVFEVECVEDTYELGDRVGVAADGTRLAGQKVAKVAAGSPQLAIGRIVKQRGEPSGIALFEVHSTVLRDGPQGVP